MATDKLAANRVVYHRGSVVYARFKYGDSEDYRHPLDVPNGRSCGCICDDCGEDLLGCANDPEKIAAEEYSKIPYFAHQSNTVCTPSGERGLLEAFRIAIEYLKSIYIPEARYSSGTTDVLDSVYRSSARLAVTSSEVLPKVVGMPYELLLETPEGNVHLAVVAKRISELAVATIKGRSEPTILACMMPNFDGTIVMGEVLAAVWQATSLSWLCYPDMEVYSTEQRRLRETQEEALRREKEEVQAEKERVRKERIRELDEEAKRKGFVKMQCAACHEHTEYAKGLDAWIQCPICRRYTSFYPMKG